MSTKLPHKINIVNTLYQTHGVRDFTRNELMEYLEKDMSNDVFIRNFKELVKNGLIRHSKETRYCSVTKRLVRVYTMKVPPAAMRLLFQAEGLLKPQHIKEY